MPLGDFDNPGTFKTIQMPNHIVFIYCLRIWHIYFGDIWQELWFILCPRNFPSPIMLYQTASLVSHWGRVTHICVSKLTIMASDNGLSPGRRQAIIWTNAGILLIGPLGTNFNEISIKIHIFFCKKIHLKMSSGKWRPFCLGLNVLYALSPGHVAYTAVWGLLVAVFLHSLQQVLRPGPLFTKMTPSYQYRDSHYKPETVVRPS